VDVDGALTVQVSVRAVQPADQALATAVVPAILASGNTMEVKVDAESVPTAIFDSA